MLNLPVGLVGSSLSKTAQVVLQGEKGRRMNICEVVYSAPAHTLAQHMNNMM
jgi:hypothetical protein